MNLEEAFLQAIREAPDDDTPRLIYADWLEERGDPRGEFLRLQCQLARLRPDDARYRPLKQREEELRRTHESDWLGPLRQLGGEGTFHRGLLEDVLLLARQFLAAGDALFQLAPVRRVHLWGVAPHLAELAASPLLSRLHDLDLSNNSLDPGSLRVLGASPYLGRLRSLNLRSTGLRFRDVLDLAHSPHWSQLTRLDLSGNDLGPYGLQYLANAPHLGGLRGLLLRQCRLGAAVQPSQPPPALNLGGFSITSRGLTSPPPHSEGGVLRPLIAAPLLSALTELALGGNALGDAAVAELLAAPQAAGLVVLDLGDNALGRETVRVLAGATHLRNLRGLVLAGNLIEDEDAAVLSEAPHLQHLALLDLRRNPLGERGAGRLQARFGGACLV